MKSQNQKNGGASELYESEAKILRHLHFSRELDEEAKIKVFSHEWTSYPSSLFEVDSENNIIMRKGNLNSIRLS